MRVLGRDHRSDDLGAAAARPGAPAVTALPTSEPPRLRRVLGPIEVTASGVGIIVGAGIYASPLPQPRHHPPGARPRRARLGRRARHVSPARNELALARWRATRRRARRLPAAPTRQRGRRRQPRRRSAKGATPMTRLLTEHHTAEVHRGSRAAWLRAAVLGANDGLISTASLIVVAGRRTCRPAQVALRPRLRSTSRRAW